MIAFRQLESGDLEFLVEVRNACRSMLHDDTERSLVQAVDWFESTRPRFYLLTLDGNSIGYFRTSRWDDPAGTVYIGCDLHPRYQRQGLALKAYPVFLGYLFEDCGMQSVLLEVLAFNQRARRLYDRLGFLPTTIEGQRVWRAGRFWDSIQMSLAKADFESGRFRQRPSDRE